MKSTEGRWVASDLNQKFPNWCYTLTLEDIEELNQALIYAKRLALPVCALRPEDFPLKSLKATLSHIQQQLEDGPGIAKIEGLDIRPYSRHDLDTLLYGISLHLGRPVSQSHSGDMVHAVQDEGYDISHPKARGTNTRRALNFHTDTTDIIGFLCVHQAASGGQNQIICAKTVHDIIAQERPDLLPELYTPYYWQRHKVDLGNNDPYHPTPIFAKTHNKIICQYISSLIRWGYENPDIPNITEKQQEAMAFFDGVMRRDGLAISITQQPGELLFINNYSTLHARDQFSDNDNTHEKRLLLRTWIAAPNSRELPEILSSRYGNTQAGAVRGGIMPCRD